MQFPSILAFALSLASSYMYPLIFIGTIIEGPIIMVACGFFLRFGTLSLVPVYLVLVLADLLADIVWYYVGYFYAEPILLKHGKFLSITPEVYAKVKNLFDRYHTKILIISKITVGFGLALATLVVAGATRVPFRKFFIINLIGELILVAVLMLVGYFFGELYNSIARGFRDVFIVAAFVALGVGIYGFSMYAKKRALEWK